MKYFVLFGKKYPVDLDKPYDEKDDSELSEEFIEARKNLVASWSQMPIDPPFSDLYRKLEQELDKKLYKKLYPDDN